MVVTAARLVMALLAALRPEAGILFAAVIFLLVPCCKPQLEAVNKVKALGATGDFGCCMCTLHNALRRGASAYGESNPLYCRLGPPTFYATVLMSGLAPAVPIVRLETTALSLEPRGRE